MMNTNEISFAVPVAFKKTSLSGDKTIVLAGDVGGTKTNLALFEFTGKEFTILKEEQYHSGNFHSITAMFQEFLQEQKPAVISLGVAGPVLEGKVKITNLSWEIDSNIIKKETAVQQVALINDLEAVAYGLAALKTEDVYMLHQAEKKVPGNIAIIAPGTGLGEAGLYWNGQSYFPFATEGGHSDMSPRSETDISLYRYLQQQFGHVSWERLIAGPGIINIFSFLRDNIKREVPEWLAAALKTDEEAAVISKHAEGNQCPICAETMELFFRYLAVESANLALKCKATGGIYIGGGIVPRTKEILQQDTFNSIFLDAGRMRSLLNNVPVYVLLDDKTALKGAAYYGAYS